MKPTLLVLLLAASLPLLAADKPDPHADPFAGAFFPPELVFLARDQIKLTPEQQDAFQELVEKTRYQSRSEELRVKLERETAALAALTKQARVEEAAVLAQLDKVLDAERELKHLHIGFGVALKNLITPAQEAKLREIAKGVSKGSDGFHQLEEATSKRIAEKIERVKAGAKQWAESGRDPSAILKTMEETVAPLLSADKPMEVEAALDRVLKQLTPPSGAKPKAPATASTAPATDPAEAAHKRISEKVERVKAGAQKWAENGRDFSPIAKAMEEKFRPLLEAGKVVEAEAELDRVLEQLKPDAISITRAQDEKARKHQSETGEPAIITRDYVQDEVKLSDDQKQKLSKTSPGFKPILDSQDHEKIWAFIKETMNAEQFRRFGQLEVQHDGPPALFRPKITQELKITDEQRQQFMGFVQEMTQQVQPLIQESKSAATPEKMEEFRLKVIKLRLDCLGKMVALMSAAQKQQWQEMTGQPFDTLRHH